MIGIHLKPGHTRAPPCSQDKLLLGFPQPGGCFRGTHARAWTLGTPRVSLVGPCTVNSISAWPSGSYTDTPFHLTSADTAGPGTAPADGEVEAGPVPGMDWTPRLHPRHPWGSRGLPQTSKTPLKDSSVLTSCSRWPPTPPDLGASSSVGAQASTPTPQAVSCGQRGGSEIHLPSSAS